MSDGERLTGSTEPRAAHVVVPRTARYFTLGDLAVAREVWVALHGYGQLAGRFAHRFTSIADERFIVVPEALSRFYLAPTEDELRQGEGATAAVLALHGRRVGATWMTREDRDAEMRDYVRYLDLALDDAAPATDWSHVRLCVLGFSQGTATACRWLAARARRGAPPAARLVLWAGDVPPELSLSEPWLRETRLTLVAGDADPFATPAAVAAITGRLANSGVPYQAVVFAGGHEVDGDALARVAASA